MNVTWSVANQKKPTSAPHELAWQYALDMVLAHAYTHRITHLQCVSPWQPIVGLIKPNPGMHVAPNHDEEAIAFFGVRPTWPLTAQTIYVFNESPVTQLNALRPPPPWVLRERYYVYTHRAKVFGLLMRMAQWMRRPDIEDWAVFRVRRNYVSRSPRHASYRLAVWVRE